MNYDEYSARRWERTEDRFRKIEYRLLWELGARYDGLVQEAQPDKPAPEEKTKPSINWDHVAEKWKWLAQDKNGQSYLFLSEPVVPQNACAWHSADGRRVAGVDAISSFTPGTCDWKDSLVERPTGEQTECKS